MNNMIYKNLSDFVVQIESGGRPKGGGTKSGDIPSLGAEHLTNFGGFNFENLKFIPRDYFDNMNKGIIQSEDILIVKDGATTGKVGIIRRDFQFKEAAVNEHLFILRLDHKQYYPKFLFYYLFSDLGQSYILRGFHGSAQGGITKSFVDNVKVPLIDIEIQRKIATILETCESAIQKRKQANRLTDEFLKSTFLEMFGDPGTNPKKWKICEVKDIAAKEEHSIKAGPFGSSLKKEYYVEKGYKIYGQEQVIRNDFTYGDYYIDEERYRMLENNKINEDDILISLVGTFGKISIVPKVFEPGIINPRLMKITLNKKLILPIFFKFLLTSRGVMLQIENLSHGGTMGIVNVGIMKKIKIPLPPLKLQLKFIVIVQKVEKLKQKQRDSEKELTNLFNSLMQRAFRGEL